MTEGSIKKTVKAEAIQAPIEIMTPAQCPLCGNNNFCIQVTGVGCGKNDEQCWCFNTEISFPKALLERIPDDLKGQACICEGCARAGESIFDVKNHHDG